MARPTNTKLKQELRLAKAAGATIDEMVKTFGIARNTIFYHLKEEGKDLRSKYTAEQKKYLAELTNEKLREVAARTGRSFIALQRVANRERMKEKGDLKARVILTGFLNFQKSQELKLFGFDLISVIRANQDLRKYGLRLDEPNILTHPASGKWQPIDLDGQVRLLEDPIGFLKDEAERLKVSWRERG